MNPYLLLLFGLAIALVSFLLGVNFRKIRDDAEGESAKLWNRVEAKFDEMKAEIGRLRKDV